MAIPANKNLHFVTCHTITRTIIREWIKGYDNVQTSKGCKKYHFLSSIIQTSCTHTIRIDQKKKV